MIQNALPSDTVFDAKKHRLTAYISFNTSAQAQMANRGIGHALKALSEIGLTLLYVQEGAQYKNFKIISVEDAARKLSVRDIRSAVADMVKSEEDGGWGEEAANLWHISMRNKERALV